ncbi:MAG TPA: DUF2231 domain-containing protein [Micromonosporaceae bacterium]|nr:DUF2231 domain-containing protein [Micromonosporaceae bacterium]
MQSRARLLGHAVHPMVIVFPLGLFATAVVFDACYLVTGRTGFTIAAAYVIAAGLIGGLFAAMLGLVDWLGIPRGTRARRIGTVHGLANTLVMGLFAASWVLRLDATTWEPTGPALALGLGGLVVAGVAGWLGGELVERLGVSVDDEAGLDAPSSLRGAAGGRHPGRHVGQPVA